MNLKIKRGTKAKGSGFDALLGNAYVARQRAFSSVPRSASKLGGKMPSFFPPSLLPLFSYTRQPLPSDDKK